MSDLPPLIRDQRKIDAGHLKLIGIFHFVLAAFAVIGLGFLVLHWWIMNTMLSHPEHWKHSNQAPPPKEFLAIFKYFYYFVAAWVVASGLGNALSGIFILQRRARVYSLVVAGFNCIAFPFGTVLGVFTFIVLLRESVAEVYEAKRES